MSITATHAMDSSVRLARANTSAVDDDSVEAISLGNERERPSSSPVPRSLSRFEDFDEAHFVRTDFHKSDHVLSKVHLDEDEDEDDEEEDEEESEEEEEDENGQVESNNKLSVERTTTTSPDSGKGPSKPNTQPSASSSNSTTSTKSVALPPLTNDNLAKSRHILGSTAFFDSFFGTEELDRYFPNHKLRLSILTWNMSSKPPDNYDRVLQDMLIPRWNLSSDEQQHSKAAPAVNISDQETLPEVFILGLQETPMSEVVVTNMKVGIQAVLGPNYALLQWSAMGVLHASVWIRRELLWSCTSVDTVSIHTRPNAANRIKTKGAMAMSFSLFGTPFLFINTHLSAHEANLRKRITQLDKVQQALNLKVKSRSKSKEEKSARKNQNQRLPLRSNIHNGDVDEKARKETTNDDKATNLARSTTRPLQRISTRKRMKHSEHIFWFGDLNFRLELPMESVLQAIGDIASANSEEQRLVQRRKLMRADQLSNLMDRGMAFEGFREAMWPPTFPPTYKWKANKHAAALNGTPPTTSHNNRAQHSNSESNSSSPSQSIMSSVSSINSSNPSRSVPQNLNTLVSSASIREESVNNPTDSDPSASYHNYDPARVPSYTDRILFQSRMANGDTDPNSAMIRCERYLSMGAITSSDHKPVYALFEVNLDSGGPKIPFRLRKLSKLADDISKSRQVLSRENSFEHVVAESSKNSPSVSRNISFFGKKLGRRNRGKVNINGMHASGQVHQSISMSSLPTSASMARLDKLTKLNAGAFERQVFIDGLRLRNSLLHSQTRLDETLREKNHFGLFKSRSFDSNVIEQETVLVNNNVDNNANTSKATSNSNSSHHHSSPHDQSSHSKSNHKSKQSASYSDYETAIHESPTKLDNRKTPRLESKQSNNSSICLLM